MHGSFSAGNGLYDELVSAFPCHLSEIDIRSLDVADVAAVICLFPLGGRGHFVFLLLSLRGFCLFVCLFIRI